MKLLPARSCCPPAVGQPGVTVTLARMSVPADGPDATLLRQVRVQGAADAHRSRSSDSEDYRSEEDEEERCSGCDGEPGRLPGSMALA